MPIIPARTPSVILCLCLAACTRVAAQPPASPPAAAAPPAPSAAPPTDGVAALRRIAVDSPCAAYGWPGRGVAPRSYVEGVALVFARAVCHPDRPEVMAASVPVAVGPGADDALAVYADRFAAAGMANDVAGIETLRHTYTLLLGLGMWESSGRYCEGRDVSQCFTSAESAEAGLFQTSYGAHGRSPVLAPLFARYGADQRGCLLDVFRGTITCKVVKSHNPQCPDATNEVAGTGPGADWQRLTRTCPAFATEYAAVALRTHGGPRGEFNPIRKRQVPLRPECDAMLAAAQAYVTANPTVCPAL